MNRSRDIEIYRKSVNGTPIDVIAAESGLSVKRIYAITARIRNELQISAPLTTLREDLTEQLNEMRSVASAIARDVTQDTPDRIAAVKATVTVAGRLAAMHGLDAATKTETTGTQVTYVIEGVNPDEV